MKNTQQTKSFRSKWEGQTKTQLSEEEENKLVANAKLGNRTALNRLCNEHLYLAHYWSKRFANQVESHIDKWDLFQECAIHMISLINNFTPHRGARLCTYLKTCLRNFLLNRIDQAKKRRELDSITCVLDEQIATLTSSEENSLESVAMMVSNDLMTEFRKSLTDEEYAILMWRHEELRWSEIQEIAPQYTHYKLRSLMKSGLRKANEFEKQHIAPLKEMLAHK